MIKFVLDEAGVRELLKSSEVYAECASYASAVSARAGDGYTVQARRYPERVGAVVAPYTAEALKDTFANNTLIKALY